MDRKLENRLCHYFLESTKCRIVGFSEQDKSVKNHTMTMNRIVGSNLEK